MLLCLQKDHEKVKLIREQEEKMMVSAWYNLVSPYILYIEHDVICLLFRRFSFLSVCITI